VNFGLSIDPSIHKAGLVSWVEEDGLWKPRKDKDKTKTILATNFPAMIAALDDELRFPWEWVAVEGTYIGLNERTGIALSEVVGAIWGLCVIMDIPFYKLTTKEIDKACGTYAVNRAARKLVTMAFAQRELGQGISQDVADAYCVGVAVLGERIKAGWTAAAETD